MHARSDGNASGSQGSQGSQGSHTGQARWSKKKDLSTSCARGGKVIFMMISRRRAKTSVGGLCIRESRMSVCQG